MSSVSSLTTSARLHHASAKTRRPARVVATRAASSSSPSSSSSSPAIIGGTKDDPDVQLGKGAGWESDELPDEVDVVVIGAGIGGLSCAALLGRYGLSVAVAEAH